MSYINMPLSDSAVQGPPSELAKYSAWNWRCVRKENDAVGFRLHFQLYVPPEGAENPARPFPAEVPGDTRWDKWEPIETKYYKIPQNEKELEPSFNTTMLQLGFEVDQTHKTITIPDAESFKHRLSAINGPNLRIVSTEGVLDDFEYIKVWMENDLIFSDGAESLHDFCDHTLGILRIIHMKSWNYYISTKEEYTQRLRPKVEKLEALKDGVNLEKFNHSNHEWEYLRSNLPSLAMLVSSIADSLFEKNAESFFDACSFANFRWESYFCKRSSCDIGALKKLWIIFNVGIESDEDEENTKLLVAKLEIIHTHAKECEKHYHNLWSILRLDLDRRRIILNLINQVFKTSEFSNDPASVADQLYVFLKDLGHRETPYEQFKSVQHNCRFFADVAQGLNRSFSLCPSTSTPIFAERNSE